MLNTVKSFNAAEMQGIWRNQNTKPQVVGALVFFFFVKSAVYL